MPEKFEPTIEQQKPYWQHIRELEAQLFPEFKDKNLIDSPETNNFYFAPSYHFKTGLMTETDIDNFKRDPKLKMLSVGSGPAYLERLLTHLGVDKQSIILSDTNPRDLPADFKTRIFDMFGEWPDFKEVAKEEQGFDLIIFPENPSINVHTDYGDERIEALFSLFIKALQQIRTRGEIRITGNPNDMEITEKVEQKLKAAGYNVKLDNVGERTGIGTLIIVKNETSSNTA